MPRTLGRTPVSRQRFHALTRPLVGMPVSHTWRGAGSAIFLELGALTTVTRTSRTRGEYTSTFGEVTVMLEWSWRVESTGAVQFGSWSGKRRIEHRVAALVGHTVLDISVEGRLPELVMTLDGSRWVHSFMTAEGQPRWAVRLHDDAWLAVRRGRIIRQASMEEVRATDPAALAAFLAQE
ncbi:MAG TPA: hypothetical protein VGC13_03580 [Longimicrobium sp.]|jgi:hypothetical protein|uniref:hypothetical protein n=1 Tax=Longimicrobium sp. TaxID=2029185 RepID=UPI002ED9E422